MNRDEKVLPKFDNFWETDLEDIQATYLPKGKKITDMPYTPNDWRVPVQGSPLIALGKLARLPEGE